MIRRATIAILLGAATAFAREIPDRPEKLKFEPIRFETLMAIFSVLLVIADSIEIFSSWL